MYVTLDQITLVQDKRRIRPDDLPIYERELNGERIFTTDGTPSKQASEAKRYGVIYFDSDDRLCVVPDTWSDDDAYCARMAVT